MVNYHQKLRMVCVKKILGIWLWHKYEQYLRVVYNHPIPFRTSEIFGTSDDQVWDDRPHSKLSCIWGQVHQWDSTIHNSGEKPWFYDVLCSSSHQFVSNRNRRPSEAPKELTRSRNISGQGKMTTNQWILGHHRVPYIYIVLHIPTPNVKLVWQSHENYDYAIETIFKILFCTSMMYFSTRLWKGMVKAPPVLWIQPLWGVGDQLSYVHRQITWSPHRSMWCTSNLWMSIR